MSFQDRIEMLRAKHADLEAAVKFEIARPHPDEQLLTDLKRQKLRIKDTIAQLARSEDAGDAVSAGVLQPEWQPTTAPSPHR